MSTRKNVEVIMAIFDAIEHRDPQRPNLQPFQILFHPDVEFHWPPSLPYGGTLRGLQIEGPTWSNTWDRLQPNVFAETLFAITLLLGFCTRTFCTLERDNTSCILHRE